MHISTLYNENSNTSSTVVYKGLILGAEWLVVVVIIKS